ncbi:MAG: hypothetical protein QNJ97_24200 [Myxococcota bacterium]|nr:hypothetical protein [Myxococcota bacterium]
MGTRRWKWGLLVLGCGLVAMSGVGRADPFPVADLPPALRPWVPWVLDASQDRMCPVVADESVCLWPGEVSLAFGQSGGSFEMQVIADHWTEVALPGSDRHWPQDVRVGGKQAVVLGHEGPTIRVAPGRYRISGRFFWDDMPQALWVPRAIALVALRVDGKEIPFPRRDADGTVRLQGASAGVQEDERLDLTVMRNVSDGIPLQVETRLLLRVSGKSREVTLKSALVPGAVPLSVDSDIPARVSDAGALILQVRAGTHIVTLHSRIETDVASIKSIPRQPPWPDSEIWVWQPDETLRQAGVSGPPGVDPSRTSLPAEWHGLSAFLVEPGAGFNIATKRRGQPTPPPDQLTLSREMWMDLDGEGYTVQDRLKGTLSRAWRLDLETNGTLGHVTVDGSDQLITSNPKTGKSGVELRNKSLDLLAEWRTQGKVSDLPAVGWSEDVQQLKTTVHLPPGWTVLFAKGVDNLPGTWWDQWDLWGFFFVLIISFAMAKLTSPLLGIIAFVALVLCFHETDAPTAVWVSLLASLGLLKVLPQGKLHVVGRIWCWLSIIWLAAVLIPFSVQQVRTGLFPQIKGEAAYGFFMQSAAPDVGRGPPTSDVPYPQQAEDKTAPAQVKGQLKALGYLQDGAAGGGAASAPIEEDFEEVAQEKRKARKRPVARVLAKEGRYQKKSLAQDPKAVVQTGPGVPNWHWTQMNFTWSGPVAKSHRFNLYMMSPKVNLIVSLLRVLLLVWIALRVASELLRVLKTPGHRGGNSSAGLLSGKSKAASATAMGVLLVGLLTAPQPALAEEGPSESRLTQLLEKLTRAPACRPDCVSAAKLSVSVREQRILFRAEVHSGDVSSWPIPGPAKHWVPAEVRVNGQKTLALATRPDGFIHVRLEPGAHEVVAEGLLPPGNTLTIEFGLTPHHVSADAPGFVVEGISENGRSEGSIQLSRSATTGSQQPGQATFEEGSYPPWLEISRTFDFGIPWLLHTHVRRVSPVGMPLVMRIPLLQGEAVTESEVQVEQGEAVVSLGRDQTEFVWSSTLAEQPQITLAAPTGKPWTELWTLQCSPVWQCAHNGLAPIDSRGGTKFQPVFMPWPGESLDLSLTKPSGVEGQSITIDAARLILSPGIRLVKAELMLWIRSSQGGSQVLTLPKGAQVQTLTVDGAERTFRVQGEKLEVNLIPGSQQIKVAWQQSGGIDTLYRVPEVRLGRECANVTVTVKLPEDRWLLLAGGPNWGPAVLFWGVLITILLGGLILGRMKLSPLKSWQWMLLAIGLTQVPVVVTLIIVGWFLVLAWRAKTSPESVFLHNALQIILALWTLAALGCLVGVVYNGLAVRPDMQVQGAGSTNTSLIWYVDRIQDALPTPWVASVPILVWKLIMLAWALWLAGSIIKWAPWAWRSFSARTLWRRRSKQGKKEDSSQKG